MVKLFVALFITLLFSSIFALATLGARKEHKEWAEILNNNNSRTEI